MIDLGNLSKLIKSNKIDEAIEVIEDISANNYTDAVPFLLNHLKITDNHLLRNSIALTLMDIGNQEVVEPIIELLTDSKTLGYRGTLLYSLKQFDCSVYLEVLIDFTIDGNFEVRHISKEIIEEMDSNIKDELLLKSIVRVKRAINELEDKHTVLSETLDALCNLK
jgi:HEAT repeat protein